MSKIKFTGTYKYQVQISFGKIDFNGIGKKINELVIELQIRDTKNKEIDLNNLDNSRTLFTSEIRIYNKPKTNFQTVAIPSALFDYIIDKHYNNNERFKQIYDISTKYNGLLLSEIPDSELLRISQIINN